MTNLRKLLYLLSPNQKRAAGVLIILMFIGMLLETLGIGLVIPALRIMTEPDIAEKYPSLEPTINRLGEPSKEQLVILGMLVLVVAYVVKALFLSFLAWRQSRFVADLQAKTSYRLFAGYLNQPYMFHLQRNSAELIRNVIGKVDDVVVLMRYGLQFATEMSVVVGISALLLFVEPIGALAVGGVLSLAAITFNGVTKRRVVRWGNARQLHEQYRIQFLQQGLGGAKEVKLFGREDEFLGEYDTHNIGSARVAQSQRTLIAMPRLWLEVLAMLGLAALVLVMIGQGKPVEQLVPTLGLFGAAAFRLMPSVNRVLSAVQTGRFYVPAIESLYEELCLLKDAEMPVQGEPLPFQKAITLEGVSFRYPSARSRAVRDIDLVIEKGSAVGLIGESGAGKSTLVDLMLGLLTPESGVIKIDGKDIQQNLRGWQDQIGYVPQSIFLTDDTLRRNVAFGLRPGEIDEASVLQAVKAAQLDRFVSELPDGLDTIVGERGVRLSGGQRQRIGIARALYHSPPVLVLDEATSSLDTRTERGVMAAVSELKGDKTLIIIAHRLSTIEACDHVYRIDEGTINMVVKQEHDKLTPTAKG